MKKLILATLVSIFAFAQVQAQELVIEEQPHMRNIIKVSPFHFVEGTFLLSYERFFSNMNTSIYLNAGIHSRERFFDEAPQFGFQEEAQLRVYVAPPRNVGSGGKNFFYFKGLYAGPFLYHRYRDQTVQVWDWIAQENVQLKERINEVAGGVLLGVQIAFANRLFVDFYTGGGIKRSFGRNENNTFVDVTTPGYNGVIPKIGFQIGIGF